MTKTNPHPMDPRSLIAEAYNIEGIGVEDCRSIFFDWALGLDASIDPAEAARELLAYHRPPADHPMTGLLKDAVDTPPKPRRRRGRRVN
ncbi:hypothetical protein KHP62_08255 [Rhodobacteraceae bacterium NNCM2]|nr:hypothetical protein [Coraliihabitans acroporae]